MRTARFEVVALAAAVVTVVVLSAFSSTGKRLRSAALLAEERRRVAAKVSQWDSLTYSSITSDRVGICTSNAVLGISKRERTDEMCAALAQTVAQFFEYQAHPTFEKFIYDRTNGGNYRIHVKGGLATLLRRDPQGIGSTPITNGAPEIAVAWQILRVGNHAVGNDTLESIATSTFRLNMVTATNPPVFGLSEAARDCTFVARSFHAGVDFADAPRNWHAANHFAQLSFVGRFAPSGKSSPIYAFWVWSESGKRWLPETMLFDVQCRYASLF